MTLVLSMIEFQHCLIRQQWVYRTIGRSSRWVVDQFSFDEMRWQQKIWPCCTHDQFENGLNWKKSEFFSSISSFRSREILLIKSSPGRLRWKSIFWRRQPLIKIIWRKLLPLLLCFEKQLVGRQHFRFWKKNMWASFPSKLSGFELGSLTAFCHTSHCSIIFLRWAIPSLFFLYFCLFFLSVQLENKIMPMFGFKTQIFGVGSDRSNNWATTTDQITALSLVGQSHILQLL